MSHPAQGHEEPNGQRAPDQDKKPREEEKVPMTSLHDWERAVERWFYEIVEGKQC